MLLLLVLLLTVHLLVHLWSILSVLGCIRGHEDLSEGLGVVLRRRCSRLGDKDKGCEEPLLGGTREPAVGVTGVKLLGQGGVGPLLLLLLLVGQASYDAVRVGTPGLGVL